MLKMLLEAGAGDTPARHGQTERIDERTAPIDACEEHKAEAAQLLLKYKSNVNAADHDGNTLITQAIEGGNISLVRMLLDATPPADVNLRLSRCITALFDAAHRCKPVATLIVRMLLDAGADPRVADDDGKIAFPS
jgi:ankyrin repeat protein